MNDLNNTANTNTTATNTATNQDRTQRDEKGRFSKGNPGGPGNPFARQTAQLRQAALEAVSAEDMCAAMKALTEKAAAGNVAAIRLLLSYTVGKPTPAVDPDTLDQQELKTIVNNHVRTEESIVHVIQGMPIEALLIIFRAALPELLTSKMQTIKDVLTAPPAEEDDDDDLVFEDDAEDAASGATHGAAGEASAGNDNIPAWMYEMANANRAVPPAAAREKPQRDVHKGATQEAALLLMQKQLQELLNAQKQQRSSAAEQEPGRERGADEELLRSLSGRMRGTVASADEAAPPSPDGLNGTIER